MMIGIDLAGKSYNLIAKLLREEKKALVRIAKEETGGVQDSAIEDLVTATIAMRELRISDGE